MVFVRAGAAAAMLALAVGSGAEEPCSARMAALEAALEARVAALEAEVRWQGDEARRQREEARQQRDELNLLRALVDPTRTSETPSISTVDTVATADATANSKSAVGSTSGVTLSTHGEASDAATGHRRRLSSNSRLVLESAWQMHEFPAGHMCSSLDADIFAVLPIDGDTSATAYYPRAANPSGEVSLVALATD